MPALHCSGCVQEACASTVGAVGWSGEPLLDFGLFLCWAASAAGTGLLAEVAFYSRIFFFQVSECWIAPKAAEVFGKRLRIITADFH